LVCRPMPIPPVHVVVFYYYTPRPLGLWEYHLANARSERIAFCLVAINGYDLLAALQNNGGVTLYSVGLRLFATAFFSTLGPGYAAVAPVEFATAVLIAAGLGWEWYRGPASGKGKTV